MAKIKPTNENLDDVAAPMIARWLIEAAESRTDVTYGEARRRLEAATFTSIGRATKLGRPAGTLMDRIHEIDPEAPLLNSLLVLQSDHMPSTGVRFYFSSRFGLPQLEREDSRVMRRQLWRVTFERSATEVYSFTRWPELYEAAFGERYRKPDDELAPRNPNTGKEIDGLLRGRTGEGPNHRALRLWVLENPDALFPNLNNVRSETEIDLDSGDRVDVVYYHAKRTIALEVKSADSNYADLRRGVFQCIKYRAVMNAMDPRSSDLVQAVLVTESPLPGDLADLAKLNGVSYRLVPVERS